MNGRCRLACNVQVFCENERRRVVSVIFVCDVMLGKLAKYLRMLGFDAPRVNSLREVERYATMGEGFLFLTRRKSFSGTCKTLFIISDKGRGQLLEIKNEIRPYFDPGAIMSRCMPCNCSLADIDRTDIEGRVPEHVFHLHTLFKICPSCARVYWEGTHAEKMSVLVREVFG